MLKRNKKTSTLHILADEPYCAHPCARVKGKVQVKVIICSCPCSVKPTHSLNLQLHGTFGCFPRAVRFIKKKIISKFMLMTFCETVPVILFVPGIRVKTLG